MNIQKLFKNIILPLTIILSASTANAAVIGPKLDINGNGATVTGTTIDFTAGVGLIITGDGNNIVLDEILTLSGLIVGPNYNNTNGGTFSGTFSVSGGLLSGSFSELLVSAPVTLPPIFPGAPVGPATTTFSADLIYTSGSLAGSLSGGRIEGVFTDDGSLLAKLGAVSPVPVPAAVWLFGSGLLGLVGVARRRA